MTKLICLMPTYNKEETIAKAIESVMCQKTNFEYKLIILDDCSNDNSNNIAKEYQQKYPDKIEIVRNETNLKLLYSIMRGYKLLKGADYFCVLDADDYYTYDKKFQEAVDFLDNHKDFSMYMTNIVQKQQDTEKLYYEGDRQSYDFDFTNRKSGQTIFIQTSGVVYRNLYFKNGSNKRFEKITEYKYPQSYRADGFRFEWYLQGGKAHFVNKQTAVYNYNMEGIWSSMTDAEQLLNNAKIMYACAEFFKEESFFYISEARLLYKEAMRAFKNTPDSVFAKNKELITDLALLIFEPQKTVWIRIFNFIISLIPNKKIRQKIRKRGVC